MNKHLVSVQLSSGQTIIGEMEETFDENGFYVIHNPVRPVLVGENMVMVSMNPFSDSRVFKVHPMHVVSVGSIHFQYIDMYHESVDRIEEGIKQKYMELTTPVKLKLSNSIMIEGNSTVH